MKAKYSTKEAIMNFEDLKKPELQEKLMSAKTSDDLIALVKDEGIELSDEELDNISGGEWLEDKRGESCPWCGCFVEYASGVTMPRYCPHCNGQIVY